MYQVRWLPWGLLVLASVGCSSTSSPLERGRSPIAGGDANDGRQAEQGSGELGDDSGGAEHVAPGETTPPSDSGGYWTLVRSEDSRRSFAEEWTYDAASRLVKAHVVRFTRDVDPYYALDVTITYDGNHVTSVHDRPPERGVDVRHDYELREGRVVEYEQVVLAGSDHEVDEVFEHQTFLYDDAGRLIGSEQTESGYEALWTLERRDGGGEPTRLLRNGEVVCTYGWRHVWYGTTCYNGGVESELYQPDAAQRLGSLTWMSDGSTVSYTYHDAGHLTSQTTGTSVYEYVYSADAKLLEMRWPGYEEVRTYDEAGLLQEIRWSGEEESAVTKFTYERLSATEVVETETSPDWTIVRTYKRLSHPPTGEPQLPSFWTILGMDQPSVYMKPVDYSAVP